MTLGNQLRCKASKVGDGGGVRASVWDPVEEGGGGGMSRQIRAPEGGRVCERRCLGVRSSTVRVEGWAQGSTDVQGSESAGESGEGVCVEGVYPVSPIDVAAPGRDPAEATGSPLPSWPPVPRETCTAGQCIR